ncbi:NAD(P)H-hydrate dehydratase [Thermodesulforhabdus norvegica]|uniref:Bifunctional NAD(P)H-hydrate repair enzyme n=1 Tax=Thermodesulforhabdus norvegica TaxID=39841 RepID=A0A1I4QP71_9BACT|nr:NAD(P)H-hydrate dehydratase [Thermodesulforhabdus norvegica]SFM41483.1 NAD(P)H-hydrate epimerase [Thermodesulforhabdus norvegica]
MYLVTPSEMAEIDRITIRELGIPGVVLMENAGRGAFSFFCEILPDFLSRKIAVVCGRGNNAGDGFVIARLCYSAGADVRVILLTHPEVLVGDALTNFEILQKLYVPVYILDSEGKSDAWDVLRECNVVVDAIFGTGLSREVTGIYRKAIETINSMGVPVLAVDIPSGVDGSSGRIMGVAVRATATATFGLPKIGHVQWPGAENTGRLKVLDIGFPPSVIESRGLRRYLLVESLVGRWLQKRNLITHKGNAGHVAILAGSPGKTGAAAMAAMGAVRGGAGLVTLMVPKSLNPILEEKITEPMTLPLDETLTQTVSLSAEEKIISFVSSKQCFALGPGLSLEPEPQYLVRKLIPAVDCPMVIDADGLTAISENVEVLRDARAPVILTPHPGEMARLTGMTVPEIQADRLGVAQTFSREYGVIVVLKGFRTVVASPDGRAAVNTSGNPAMASGGMGDILTGLISAFLAQGMDPFEAACTGVYVHGAAADRVVREKLWGTRGLAATDLLDWIPRIIAELEAWQGNGTTYPFDLLL